MADVISAPVLPPVFSTRGRRLWVPFALAALSLWLISRWVQVWWVNPELGHGWLVPLLTAFLLRERWVDRPATLSPHAAVVVRLPWLLLTLPVAGALAVSRLLLEPFPQWPLVLWIFSGLCYGLIFALIAATGGARLARHFVMPFVFSATALPWPGVIDHEVILPLREGFASIVAEITSFAGHPAIAQGTVVEIGRGFVGVDEACSGVRSLQTVLAVSLFLGEMYRLSAIRRLTLLGVGLFLALATNFARTLFLSLQCAWHGAEGVARWHDTAGMLQLILCLGGLLFIGWRWGRQTVLSAPSPASALPITSSAAPASATFAPRLAIFVIGFILVVETGTQAWFNMGSRIQRELPQWEVNLPSHRPGFKAEPFTKNMQTMLACDAHELGHWQADDGTLRSGYILEWNKGQAARFSPSMHDPTVCLPMSGSKLLADEGLVSVAIGELTLPFHAYTFSRAGTAYHVFYIAWDLTTNQPLKRGSEIRDPLDWFFQQWQDVRAARRDIRARVIGLAIYGSPNLAAASSTLEAELGQLSHPFPSERP